MIKASEENLAREEKTHSEFRQMLMKEISDLRSKKASFLLNRLKEEEEDYESDSTQEMCAQAPNSPGNSEDESEGEEGEIRTSKRWKIDDFKK
jgi:PHD/YefM family antitoxin component YafN of YafNO toxin-antitoxin module